jgi:hypothetical protein
MNKIGYESRNLGRPLNKFGPYRFILSSKVKAIHRKLRRSSGLQMPPRGYVRENGSLSLSL